VFDNFYCSVYDIFITFIYLKLSFIFDVINISFFFIQGYNCIIHGIIHITFKGRASTEDHVVPLTQGTGIEEVINYSRYFSTKRQMMVLEKMFHSRPVLSPKAMHSPYFAPGFQFQNLLNFQGLQPFLGMKLLYYEDLVRVFYTNPKIIPIGDLSIEICSKRIHINQMDWMNIANLRYDGVKLTLGTILEKVNFD